ncbi:hypothetical protein D3C87_1173050 [compost metagenome]
MLIQQGWSSPVSGQREGVIHLKRGLETVDVDSLLDTNQPDFFLRIEMDPPASGQNASPMPKPTASAEPREPQESAAKVSPKPLPSPKASPELAEEELQAAPSPTPGSRQATPPSPPEPRADASDRMQIVADALYHAPRLAQQGRYRQALEVVDAALGVDDRVAPLHALRGSLCFKLGRERQAEEGWARALELDPKLSDAQQALDWIRNRRR